MIVCCWIKNLKSNVNSTYIFGFLNFYIVPFFLMSQVFKVWISECPSFLVKYYGNPSLTTKTTLRSENTGLVLFNKYYISGCDAVQSGLNSPTFRINPFRLFTYVSAAHSFGTSLNSYPTARFKQNMLKVGGNLLNVSFCKFTKRTIPVK
jgi:hypothetical protein